MIGPKEKKERALGEHLHLKGYRCVSPKCALTRKPYRPGAHGRKRQKKGLSDFGRQLREKQKVKVSYGINERNLRLLFEKASKAAGSTSVRLVEFLERRLDNAVFRLGLAASRSMARQLIVHGHIVVNGRGVQSPGYGVKVGDTIGVRPTSLSKSAFQNLKESIKVYEPPSWLTFDKEKLEGRVVSAPVDITLPYEVSTLVESFSK